MRLIRISGLIVFIAGFILFNATPFLADYRLTPQIVQEQIRDSSCQQLFAKHAETVVGTTFRSSFSFVSALNKVFAEANGEQLGFDRYLIRELKYSLTKASTDSPVKDRPALFLFLTFGLCLLGAGMYLLPPLQDHPGIKNNGIFFSPMKNRGWLGILTGTWLIAFYLLLYFYPEHMTSWVIMVDPISNLLNGHEAGKFFLYGFMYTLAILVMGIRFILRYRHSGYQIARTLSVMFFQTAFAFLIPEILIRLQQPYYDFKNIWPLDYTLFFDYRLSELVEAGALGIFMIGWGIALIVIGVPVMVYLYGKRWYCS